MISRSGVDGSRRCPAYNEHLTRDVGELFLATGLVLLVAATSSSAAWC